MVVGARIQCTNVPALFDETGNECDVASNNIGNYEKKTYKSDNSDVTQGIENRLDHVFVWPHSLSDESTGNQVRDLPKTSNEINADIRREGNVLIRVITWNHQAKDPPSSDDLIKWLVPRNKYHIIAFGSQECENSIAKSIIVPTKERWEAMLNLAVGPDYDIVCSHSLQASHNMVFVHKAIVHLISNIKSAAIPTGFGDLLGNKGGIGVSFLLGKKSFCFINAHLAAHQYAIERRTYEFQRISSGVAESFIRKKENNSPGIDSSESTSNSTFCLANEFDFVFWYGDLNFRVNGTREVVDGLLAQNMHEVLVNNDQLTFLMKFNSCFRGLAEGPINFRPTYKFDYESDIYDTSKKKRIPSWTDRILFKNGELVDLITYSSRDEIRTSDHRPVYASFRVKLPSTCCISQNGTVQPFLNAKPISQICSIS